MTKAIMNWLAACREWHDPREYGREYLEQRARIEGVDLPAQIAYCKASLRHSEKIVRR